MTTTLARPALRTLSAEEQHDLNWRVRDTFGPRGRVKSVAKTAVGRYVFARLNSGWTVGGLVVLRVGEYGTGLVGIASHVESVPVARRIAGGFDAAGQAYTDLVLGRLGFQESVVDVAEAGYGFAALTADQQETALRFIVDGLPAADAVVAAELV